MHPWQAVSELAQFRHWLRENARPLVESIAVTATVEPAVVLRVLDALHCQAMGGKASGDPCLSELAESDGDA